MTTEFDIDTPADLELLGGSEEEEIEPGQEDEAEEEAGRVRRRRAGA
jgi:hypothetical protein